MSAPTTSTHTETTAAVLFRQLQPRLRTQVGWIVRTSSENIEDACAFAWLQLLRNPPAEDATYNWLLKVAIRKALKLNLQSRRTRSLDADPHSDDRLELSDERRDLRLRIDVLDAMAAVAEANLTARQREILALQVVGFGYDEIASITGDTIRTVERQLLRAREKLRRARSG
jgi:RNA polymerase sigma factor (sigma-70 family)